MLNPDKRLDCDLSAVKGIYIKFMQVWRNNRMINC